MVNLFVLLSAGSQLAVVGVVVALFIFFIIIVTFLRRYKRCPSDRILVVYGKVGKNNEGGGRTAKCIHGGAAFIWPIIQDFEFLDLTPVPIVVDLRAALSKQNIRVNVPSRFMVGISVDQGVMDNAAERLLGLSLEAIHDLAADIIFGQLRVVIATMDIEEINTDREKFLINVSDAVEHELKKIGLKLINVNITDITDENGYIEALGKEATAQAINDAKKVVAEKTRDGSIGEAIAKKEERIQVAGAISEAEIGEAIATQKQRTEVSKSVSLAQVGEAEAEQLRRIEVAKFNASAVESENLSQVKIADSNATRRKAEAEAQKIAVVAEKINEAQSKENAYSAEQKAELARAEREKATQIANIVIPAEIQKQKIEIDAEAEAERIRRIAKGNADSTFFSMEAQAKGVFEILSKQADGYTKLVKSAGNDPKDAVMLMISDKLPELIKTQVEAIKNIKIDKVTVWENGSGKDGKTSTANFISGMAGSIPPLEDLFKMAGLELPAYLGKKKEEINSIKKDNEITES
jgi:flotillin